MVGGVTSRVLAGDSVHFFAAYIIHSRRFVKHRYNLQISTPKLVTAAVFVLSVTASKGEWSGEAADVMS